MAFSGATDEVTFSDLSKAWDETNIANAKVQKLLKVIEQMTNMAANTTYNDWHKRIYEIGKQTLEENAK